MLRLPAIIGLMALEILGVTGAPAAEADAVTITNSGSTNRAGFRIIVDQAGSAEFTALPRKFGQPQENAKSIRRVIPRASVERLRADLKAAKPLALLPAIQCMKSASFGSTLTVALGGEQTPDLSCGDGGNASMRNLARDVSEIIALFQSN